MNGLQNAIWKICEAKDFEMTSTIRRGGIMKKTLFTVMLSILSAVVLCTFSLVQAATSENASAADLLIKSEVETAVSMLKAIYTKHQKGEINLQTAKKLGADILRDLRYGTDGYFWADTTEGVNIVLYGRKEIEGKNRLEDRYPMGTYYVK